MGLAQPSIERIERIERIEHRLSARVALRADEHNTTQSNADSGSDEPASASDAAVLLLLPIP